jgi:hypothetical protein
MSEVLCTDVRSLLHAVRAAARADQPTAASAAGLGAAGGLAVRGADKNASAASARVTAPSRIAVTPGRAGLLLRPVTATGTRRRGWPAGR